MCVGEGFAKACSRAPGKPRQRTNAWRAAADGGHCCYGICGGCVVVDFVAYEPPRS